MIEVSSMQTDSVEPLDVTYARMKFPFRKMFYPLGFPVEITTNEENVLGLAAESWGKFPRLFETPPIRVQIGVLDGGSGDCPPIPTCRVRENLFSFVGDSDNYGVADMARGYSFVWLSRSTLRYRSFARYYFLECTIMCQLTTRYATGVHAGCVEKNGSGILLAGNSGAGKSTLSYACAKAGWTYITDDGAYLLHGHDDLLVVGNCNQVRFRPSATQIFPETEGRAVMQRSEIGKPSIEGVPADLAGIRCSPTTRIKHFVFLNRNGDRNEGLAPYSKEKTRQFLSQNRFTPEELVPLQNEAIERLLQLDVLELRYKDFSWAIEELEKLVESGRP